MIHSHFMLASLGLVALGGCLDGGSAKNACQVPADCLAGYRCVERTCVRDDTPPPPDARGTFYGTVEPLVAQSAGLAAINYETLAGLTTAPGNLGCAVVSDFESSPGTAAAALYAMVYEQGGDARCREGVFAILNDPDECLRGFPVALEPGCALYKRWDGNGQQVAYQLAIGGYVSTTQSVISSNMYRCETEASIRFAGGVTIAKTFQFDYDPGAPGSAHCAH